MLLVSLVPGISDFNILLDLQDATASLITLYLLSELSGVELLFRVQILRHSA